MKSQRSLNEEQVRKIDEFFNALNKRNCSFAEIWDRFEELSYAITRGGLGISTFINFIRLAFRLYYTVPIVIARDIVRTVGIAVDSGKALKNKKSEIPSGFLIRALLPPEEAEERLVNLEFWFLTVWCKKHSLRVAKILFYCQIVRTIIAYYGDQWKSWIELWLPKRG
jgi:hypothetical protein